MVPWEAKQFKFTHEAIYTSCSFLENRVLGKKFANINFETPVECLNITTLFGAIL